MLNYNCYSKTTIRDGKYVSIRVEETVVSEKEIVQVDDTVFKVTHCGAYGQIKIHDGFREFVADNQLKYAMNKDFDKVLDLRNAEFNISREAIKSLHNEVYMKRLNDEYWVAL